MLVSFGVSLWMYGTPVAYSLDIFAGSSLETIILLNPMTSVIESTRYALLGSNAGSVSWGYYLISWIMTGVILFTGLLLFHKVEKNFMDTV